MKKFFALRRTLAYWRDPGAVKAVDGISFRVFRGETFGIVGESGCGKSTVAKMILKVVTPTEGQIIFMNNDIAKLEGKRISDFRRNIQAVYQDPYSSLNPRMRIGKIIGEPLLTNLNLRSEEMELMVVDLLGKVGLSSEQARRYPHEFSGGQRQRIGIARALSVNPQCVVLDEPVSALDVSIRSQILNLLKDLQDEFQLTYLFISHDLSVVEHICDRVAVMYLGKILEEGTKRELFDNPLHPYTQGLLCAVPIPDPDRAIKAVSIKGEIPSALDPPMGCRFHTRCSSASEACRKEPPEKITVNEGHWVSCHQFSS